MGLVVVESEVLVVNVVKTKNRQDIDKFFPKIPSKFRRKAKKESLQVYLVDNMLQKTGCYGLYDTGQKIINLHNNKIFHKEVRYHEFGHFVDTDRKVWLSDKEDFQKIYTAEKKKFKRKVGSVVDMNVLRNNSCEYFAYCFQYYLLYPKHLKKYCPKTYKYFKKLING